MNLFSYPGAKSKHYNIVVSKLAGPNNAPAEVSDRKPIQTTIPATPSGIFTAVQGNNAELMATVTALYLNLGDRVADVTFGKGVFWRSSTWPNTASVRLTC